MAQGTAGSLEAAKEEFSSIAIEASSAGRITQEELTGILDAIASAKTPDDLNAAFATLNDLIGATGSSAVGAADDLQRLLDLVNELRDAPRDVDEASRRLAEAQRRTLGSFVSETTGPDGQKIQEINKGIDEQTEAGARNADAIRAQVEASERLAEAQALLDPTGQQSTLTLLAQRKALEDLAAQGLISAGELEKLVEIYGLTDQDINATVSVETTEAKTRIAEVQTEFDKVKDDVEEPIAADIQAKINAGDYIAAEAALQELARTREAKIRFTVAASAQSVVIATEKAINLDINGNGVVGMAAGGIVPAGSEVRLPGFGTDTVPTMLTVGEHVMPEHRVSQPGMLPLLEGLRSGVIDPKSIQGFADGGLVTTADAPTWREPVIVDPASPAQQSEMTLDPLLAEIAAQRSEIRALVDAITAVVTRPQAAPVIDVHASDGVLVTAQRRARGVRSGD